MASTPLESVVENWRQRDIEAQALKIPRSSYQELAKRDIKNVTMGGAPLANTDVNIALLSQAMGQSVIPKPERGTGPKNIIGNVPKDTEDIVRNFIPGMASWAWNLPKNIGRSYLNPQGATAAGRAELGYEPDKDFGARIRNLQRDPLTGLIPGVFTIAKLTNPEGRKELQQRPVTTFLDVLPFASKAAKIASGGEAVKAGTLEAAEKGTARSAFQQGHVTRGAFRATSDTLGKVPVVGKVLGRDSWNKFAADLGVNELARERLSRPFSVMTRKADKQQAIFLREKVQPLVDGLDEAGRADLTYYAQRRKAGDIAASAPDYNPEYEAILAQVDKINDRFADYSVQEGGVARVHVPGAPKPLVYSADSPVVLAQQRRVRAQDALARIEHRRGNAELTLDKWTTNLKNRVGKVRGFMETPEAFAARGEGAVGPEVIREAARPMVEAFQNLDPEAVFREYLDKIQDGMVRAQTGAYVLRDFRKLKGEADQVGAGVFKGKGARGLISQLDEALASGDLKRAGQVATEVNRILRHKSWDAFDTTTRIRRHITDIRSELVGLRKRTTSFGYASRMVKKAEDRLSRYQELESAARTKVAERDAQFYKDLMENPATNFHPLIVDKIRAGAIDEARLLYADATLADVEAKIAQSPTMTEISTLIGKEAFDRIFADVRNNWLDLVRQGYDPVWVHHVDTARHGNVLKPRILPDIESRPGLWHDTVLNFGPGVMDVAVGLGAASAELISRQWTSRYISEFVMPHALPKEVVREELIQRVTDGGRIRPSHGVMGEVNNILKREYKDFDPNKYGMKWANITREGLVLPVGMDRALNMFERQFQYIPVRGIYDKALKVYKFSVLAGFKQFADSLFGGALTTVMYEPKALFKMRDVYALWKAGKIPEELAHNFYELGTDQVFQIAAGNTMGRILRESTLGQVEKLARFEEGVTTMYRAATYLSASERLIKGGLDPVLAKEVGMRTAYKALVDFDGMSWLERTAIRQAFPFYSFMRYLMKFVFTYPADHPLRASILARFSDLERRDKEGKNGEMAQKWQNYFFIGQPDENGNVTAVDYRAANPFQSVATHFTLAGFLNGLNPLITAGFEAAGVNSLTATPDLYPDMAYDTETGTLTARRPNVAVSIGSALLPPLEGVDAAFTLSDRMRRLKEKNPEAYRRTLFQHLHLPFAFGPVNVPYEQSKAQMGRVQGAREEVAVALRTGDFERVKRYNLVPYQGQLVDPAKLETFWKTITGALDQRGLGDLSPKAILPR